MKSKKRNRQNNTISPSTGQSSPDATPLSTPTSSPISSPVIEPSTITPSQYQSPVRAEMTDTAASISAVTSISGEASGFLPGLYGRLVPKNPNKSDNSDNSDNSDISDISDNSDNSDKDSTIDLIYYVPEQQKRNLNGKYPGVRMSLVAHTGSYPLQPCLSQSDVGAQFHYHKLTGEVTSPVQSPGKHDLHTEESLCSAPSPNKRKNSKGMSMNNLGNNYSSDLRHASLNLISPSGFTKTVPYSATPLAYEIHTSEVPCSEKCIARYAAPASGDSTFSNESRSYLDHWGVGAFLNHDAADRDHPNSFIDKHFSNEQRDHPNSFLDKNLSNEQRWQNYAWMIVYHDSASSTTSPYAICTKDIHKLMQSASNNTPNANCDSIYNKPRGVVGGLIDVCHKMDPNDGYQSLFHTTKLNDRLNLKGLDAYDEDYIRWFLGGSFKNINYSWPESITPPLEGNGYQVDEGMSNLQDRQAEKPVEALDRHAASLQSREFVSCDDGLSCSSSQIDIADDVSEISDPEDALESKRQKHSSPAKSSDLIEFESRTNAHLSQDHVTANNLLRSNSLYVATTEYDTEEDIPINTDDVNEDVAITTAKSSQVYKKSPQSGN